MKPGKHQRIKQKFMLEGPRLCTSFLLVSSSVSSNQLLCFVHVQGQKKENKNIQQTTLSSSITGPSINYEQIHGNLQG